MSSEEAERLSKEGKSNESKTSPSKSVKQIWFSNLFTFYNILNIVIAVLVVTTGSYRNMLFMGVVISNFLIGTIQELRAKKAVDSLSVLTSPTSRAVRDGKETVIPSSKLVLGDVVIVGTGDQLTADGKVISGRVRVDESLITGESDPVMKNIGDALFSGSYVVSGECAAKLTAVGMESYAERLTAEAKKLKPAKSMLKAAVTRIINFVSAVIIPMGILTFYNHYFVQKLGYADSMLPTAASMIGMIPSGLYLLVSMSFALGVIRLAKRRTLARDIYCIESLARADVICLDKTGTITSGNMKVKGTVSLENGDIGAVIADMYSELPADNTTAKTLVEFFKGRASGNRKAMDVFPFSSELKYAAVAFEDKSYMLGAPEFILGDRFPNIREKALELSSDGTRVLLLSEAKFDGKIYFLDKPLGFILLEDEIRKNAAETFEYFRKNGVEIKVISGDNPAAVSAIAKKAGISNAEKYVDAKLLSDEELAAAAENTAIFGRVNPAQKRVIVKALQKKGHTVAMTGDGVNDVLALKDADCSIAMASGAQAAAHAAQMVLLDSDFSAIPDIVLEGRRVINNMQRVASIFLMKTAYTFAITVALFFLPFAYPFAPISMTLIGSLASGIPGVFLALEPNFKRVENDFMSSVVKNALIGAVTVFGGVMAALVFGTNMGIPFEEISSVCVIYTGAASFIMLLCSCMPLNKYKAAIILVCSGLFTFFAKVMGEIFMIVPLDKTAGIMLLLLLPLTLIQLFIRSWELRKSKN